MQLIHKGARIVVFCMSCVSFIKTDQTIVAYKAKGMDLYKPSAIHLIQDDKTQRSEFKKSTPASGKQKLTINPTGGTIEIRFYHFAGLTNERGMVTPTIVQFEAKKIPKGSKIKISPGPSGGAYEGNKQIEIEPPLVKINVKKIDPESHAKKWKIYALKKPLANLNTVPSKDNIYDSVTIEKETTLQKLEVPQQTKFWILVPDVQGGTMRQSQQSEIQGQQISSSSVLEVAKTGIANLKGL